jgi:histidyl-tRNA synthetase
MEGVSGVGISFGADRIYDVLNQLTLFNEIKPSSAEILVLNFGENEIDYALRILDIFHKLGVRAELFPDAHKLRKQMSYADSKKIPFIVIAGENEILNNTVTIKNMSSGEQKEIPVTDIELFVNTEIRK